MNEISASKEETTATNAPIMVDLGKHKRKRIRRLRKGKPGRLMDEVNSCIDELRRSGAVADSIQPVIVIVRQKKKKRKGWLL